MRQKKNVQMQKIKENLKLGPNLSWCAAEGEQDMAAVFSLRGDCRL